MFRTQPTETRTDLPRVRRARAGRTRPSSLLLQPSDGREPVTASERLSLALAALADADQRPPCATAFVSHWWLSDDPDERAKAAELCREWACPILDACHDAAEAHRERFGVWAGRDRTMRPRKAVS